MEYLELGSAPAEEDCAQVGQVRFHERAGRECRVWAEQLKRTIGEPPSGATLATKWFDHDFGRYPEVVCYYETAEGFEYAIRCEAEAPGLWDSAARLELGLDSAAA